MIASERSERAEILALLRRICFVIHNYNDDTDEKQLRNECERAKRAESFVYLHRKHTIFSIFRYNDVLVLFNLYGRNYKIYKTPKITPPPPPSTLLMTSIGSVDFI